MRSAIRIRFHSFLAVFLFTLFIGWSQRARAENADFSVYRPQSRTSEELVSLAQGLLNDQVRLKAVNEKVVIYGTKKQVDSALRLFAELDQRPRLYRVSIRAASSGSAERDARAIEAGTGGRGVSVGKRSGVLTRRGGGTVSLGGVSASAEALEQRDSGEAQQVVEVTEGSEAAVAAVNGLYPTGFFVSVRGVGRNGAHVDIRQQEAKGIHVQALSSKVDLPLGKWRSIGQVNQAEQGRSGEILGSSRSGSLSRKEIQVKVELVSGRD